MDILIDPYSQGSPVLLVSGPYPMWTADEAALSADFLGGQLVSLLPEWEKGEVGLYAVYPHRRFVSAKVRCFIEFVQERYLAPHYWDREV